MISLLTSALLLSSAATLANAACSATISSLADVAGAVACTTITLNGFTVPAGEGLTLKLASGTKVTMAGGIIFANKTWAGPLFSLSGSSITFNGNGHKFDGGGPFYWDGQGINGGIQKPDPMMNIGASGTIENVKVVNSPGRVFAISNPAAITLTGLTVDNSQGDQPNSQSGGKPAGANTDGFDVAGNNVIIEKSTVHNQDDCLAINKGTNIVFSGNSCTGGHGISVGSISSDVTVSGVVITGNTITNNVQALRIKTKATATGSTVSNITFSGNTATGITQFGVIIDQSYPSTLGTPGTGVVLSGVNFGSPATSISVGSSAKRVAVNCGEGSCTGSWNWANLKVTGGVAGAITNFAGITGFSQ
ncbi:endo-polygalacturonase PG1 [Pholiota molesta]|nr:endo-polygalacturonase PG1 [Pholiota molesta]